MLAFPTSPSGEGRGSVSFSFASSLCALVSWTGLKQECWGRAIGSSRLVVRTCDRDPSLTHQVRILHLSPGCCAGDGGCCLISGFPSSSKMLGSFGHHPHKKGVTDCKHISETYNEQTQEPFSDACYTQRLFFFFSFLCFSRNHPWCHVISMAQAPGLAWEGVQRCAVRSFSREGTATVCWRQEHLFPATGGPWVSRPQGKCTWPCKAASERGEITVLLHIHETLIAAFR